MDNLEPFNVNQSIKGKLNDYKMPMVYIKCDRIKNPIEAAIDTGAYNSHIDPGLASNMGLLSKKFDERIISSHPIEGKKESQGYYLEFDIVGAKGNEGSVIDGVFDDIFFLMNVGYVYPIILGAYFLSRCRELHIYSRQNRFELIL